MKKRNPMIRVLSVVLVLCMVLSMSPAAYAWSFSDLFGSGSSRTDLTIERVDGIDTDVKLELDPVEHPYREDPYADTDTVRVSIVLEDKPALEKFSTKGISVNTNAVNYRKSLQDKQAKVTAAIEKRALNGQELDVVWNLTLAANIISANVPYGSIERIESVMGVKEVVIEQQYEPLTTQTADPLQSNASGMIGAGMAWAAGYTGAGTRVAVIDTGLDTDHQSFDAGAFRYALEQQAAEKGINADTYIESLDLLDAEEVEGVLKGLNIYPFVEHNTLTNNRGWYVNEKVPFALNYVDRNYRVTHDNDAQGGHGSHVSGIAVANRYIPEGDGYVSAMDTVLTQGVAPDAQIIVMKVFGEQGGAYDSDYMVAIEDAIWLGCDVVNLSLGSNKGFARSRLYQDILDSLADSDTVVAIAAGNSGAWADYSANGMGALYGDDVDFSIIGSPSTATNSLAVASVENIGSTDYYLSVGGQYVYYNLGVVNNAYAAGLNTIGGQDRTYVLVDGIGTAEQAAAAAAAVENPGEAIMVCFRGEIAFYEKANNAAAAGFAGCIIANNTAGTISMDLNDYIGTGPCVSISQADGNFLKSSAEDKGNGLYVGSMYISDKVTSVPGSGNVVMSDYSSWGVPGNLELKPEISAPGGNIYSVDGEISSGDAYKNSSGTSMASPQIAGMAAVVMQYIREEGLAEKTGMSPRALATSLLMATAEPLVDGESGNYYPVLQQGSGLADVADAIAADSYIMMDAGSTSGAADGKVKAELGDDPAKSGTYSFGFTINNFSDDLKTYSLSGDFFTQELFDAEGVTYHGNSTVDLPVIASYMVGSEELVVSSIYSCDLNGDGLTDATDAKIILEHAAGLSSSIDAKADINGDDKINSFDAHLILASLESGFFSVRPGEKLHVQVTLQLADKEALASYVSGAYIEGFVRITSAPDAEGVLDPVYTIPVLGFYGDWSDASMYDRADYTDYLYNDYIYPYSGGLHYLSLFYQDDIDEHYYVGNPYLLEETFPGHKAALNSQTELGDMAVTLIRNASGFLFYVLDGEGNVIEARSGEQLTAAYYYEAYATWVNVNNVGLTIWETPKSLGFANGDEMTVGFMSVPEYYENGSALTTEEMVKMLQSGKMGDGLFHSYTFTIDDVAPVVQSVQKDEQTGNLIVTAQDENYIAAIAVLNAKGTNQLTMVGTQQTEKGSVVETVVDMSDVSVNRDCLVLVADYAGNETIYKVTGYNEGINNYAGMMYGFADYPTRGGENSWMHIQPEKLYYGTNSQEEIIMGGTSDVAVMPWTVVAAEYAGGHVFMATAEGALYVAEQGDWENAILVAEHRNFANIKDMAYDTSTGTMYALIGSANNIYTIDLFTGALTKQYSVSLSFPRTVADANYELLTLAIDDEGNFYSVNSGDTNYKRTYLFKWSEADRVDGGNVKNLAPVNNTEDGYCGDYVYADNVDYRGETCVQSMAWDHDNDRLYWASAMASVSPNNILYVFDTETGKASIPASEVTGVADYYLGVLDINIAGLYIVPTETGYLPTATEATGIRLDRTEVSLLETAEYALKTDIFPWNLENRELTWTSSDESVATVNENGTITAVSAGTATITATTAAAPNVTASCTVTVEKLESVDLRGLLFDAEGKANWVSFDVTAPEDWTTIGTTGKNFQAGALLNGNLYLHDGNHMYGVDANTFEVTDYGYVDPTWQWSDAAPATKTSNGYYDRIVGVINFGQGFGVMDVTKGIGSELPHYYLFSKDPAALIAYKGLTEYTDEYGTYPAHEYYVLTEQGTLMLMTTWAFYDSDIGDVMYADTIEDLGETGLRLTGAGEVGSGRSGSMYYDARNDYLIVSFCDGNSNELYVFDPDICAPAHVGSFGEDVWPVVSLYEYIPYSELTVTVKPENASIYIGETVELTAKVYLYESDDSVTWTSSDESVATVDENGVVTGISDGTVTITATSVEGDASASAEITIMPLDSQDIWLHAYITTEEGGAWVAINGADMSCHTLATSDAVYTGAGVTEGKVYATDHQYYYEIDPKNDYAVVQGDDFTNGDGSACLYMLDGTSAPATTVTLPDINTNVDSTAEMGGIPVYLSGYDGSGYHYITLLEDFTTGKYSVSPIAYTYNPAAIAYKSSEIISANYWFDFYMVLGYDGLLETYSLYSCIADGQVMTAGGWENDSVKTGLEFADGDDVSMVYVKNDAFEGVIITHADSDGVHFYSFDMTTNTLGKLGHMAEATDLVGLSLLSDVGVEIPSEPEIGSDVSLHGYIVTENGGAWVSIDTADMSYETQSDWSDAEYTGAGVNDGKIYASDTSKYYEIDPESGYAVTAGGSLKWGYPMLDATGVPAQTVELMDIFDGTMSTQNVGGYLIYAASDDVNTPYVFRLTDYATGAAKYSFLQSVTRTMAGIVFLSSEVSEDASAYTEHYLVLDQSGKLTSVDLVFTVGSGYLSTEVSDAEVGTLELNAASGASMALIDADTVAISVNADDGVKLYTYTISTAALTGLGVIEDAVSLTGLSLLSDVKAEEEPAPEPEPEPVESFHGYILTENGGAWVSINPADFTYETLSDWSDVEYTGAGMLDGKLYAGDTSKYYEIDPANGYAVTTGGSLKWGYPMLDGTGVPAQTVELKDVFDNDTLKSANVGGYLSYAALDDTNTSYLFRLTDYSTAAAKYSYFSDINDGIAAITLLSAGVNETADKYVEHYLALGQEGKLYDLYVNFTMELDYLSASTSCSAIGTLELTAASGASMTVMDEDTVAISVNADDGVKFYTYTISTAELTELGILSDAVTLVGLGMMSDFESGEEPAPEPEPEPEPEPDPDPVEPVEIPEMFGYVNTEDGYVWAKIDTSALTLKTLATSTVDYKGMGVSEGKIYTVTAVSKYGQTTSTYTMIDPANGFAATAGKNTGTNYVMADGTGAPAVTATLADGTTVNVGGYYVYVANGPYESSAPKLYVLNNYSAGTHTELYISSSAFSGKPVAVSYIGGGVNASGNGYEQNFLLLDKKGNLYSCTLTTTASGLNGSASVSSLGTLELTASDGASMALIGENTVMISVNTDDGVAFHTYSISTGELTELGAIYEAISMVGLNVYADIAPAAAAVNESYGSTMALVLSEENTETVDNTMTLKLVEDVDVTNGRIEVTFDPEVMTYAGASSLTASYAVNANDAASGKLVIAYASGDVIAAGEVIAALRFSYDGQTEASMTVTVTERNEVSDMNESETVELGEAAPEVVATGWSGYTTWVLTSDGTLTFSPTEYTLGGQCNLKNYCKVNGVLTLPWSAYAESITKVVIEDGIHDIGQMAFYELPNLQSVEFGADVTEIRGYAFKNCKSLTTINLGSVDFIREGAFYGCSALEGIEFADGVVIENWAFSRTNVTLP